MDIPDPDELAALLHTLKVAKVAAFKAGDLEVYFETAAPDVPGFKAPQKATDSLPSTPVVASTRPGYTAAFGGAPPSFKKPTPSAE